MRFTYFVFSAIGLLCPQIQDDLVTQDLDRLQGKWKIQAEFIEGIETQPKLLKKASVTFKGDRMVKGIKTGAALKLDPKKTPPAIDMIHADSGLTSLGIYEIDGDMLKLCYTEFLKAPTERPKTFEPTKTNRYLVLKRTSK